MKKTLALLMTLAMMLSCFVGFAVNASAEGEFVEETYAYEDVAAEYGVHDDLAMNEDYYSYDSETGFSFCDGRWTYEYYNSEDEEFLPMTAYYKDNYYSEGWKQGAAWANIYTAFPEAAWDQSGYTYCSMLGYKYLHPGSAGGASVTFVVPETGTISYEAGIFANSDTNHPNNADGYLAEDWGALVYLYINDTQVYPAEGDAEEVNRIGYHNTSKAEPLEVSLTSVKVNKNDKIRLMVLAYGGNNSSKGTYFAKTPVVTYHDAVVPVGNPNGTPPTNLFAEVDKNTNDTTVTWDAASNAASYNIYMKESDGEGDAVKVNADPITDTKYTLTGLAADKFYDVYVTTVTSQGNESAASDPLVFKTKKGVEGAPSTDTGNNDSNVNTDAPVVDNNGGDEEGSSMLLWIIIGAAAVVVIVVVVVLVVVLGKKKPAAEAVAEAAPVAEEAAPAVEEAPAAEEAAETPAEEEKKDEE